MVAVAFLALFTTAAASAQAPPALNRANAATVGVPGVQTTAATIGQPDLCLGLQSAGYGSPAIGLTLNFTHADRSCRRIRTARALADLGLRAAAVQVLCLEPEVRVAMDRAGTPCAAQGVGQ